MLEKKKLVFLKMVYYFLHKMSAYLTHAAVCIQQYRTGRHQWSSLMAYYSA